MEPKTPGYVIRQAFPAYRVFIFGKEVTGDVTSVMNNWHDGPNPSTCTITLLSPEDKYIVTHDDIVKIVTKRGYNGDIGNVENNTMPVAENSISTDVKASVTDVKDMKWHEQNGVLTTKIAADRISMPTDASNQISNVEPQSEELIERFPFQCGKPIFHPMDPVRVAFRDPFDPSTWCWIFCGFVSDFTENVGVNQEKTLTVVAESPAKLLRYARFTANSGIVDASKLYVRNAIVADIQTKTAYANLFTDMSIQQVFFAMLFGIEALGKDIIQRAGINLDLSHTTVEQVAISAHGTSSVKKLVGGVGHPNMADSRIFIFGPKDESTTSETSDAFPPGIKSESISLQEYQNRISHKVSTTDIKSMRNVEATNVSGSSTPHTGDGMSIEDVITTIGTRPDLYPVDGGRMFIMLPSNIGHNQRGVITRDFNGGSFALNTEWTTRSEVLYEIIQRAEFVFYVSPRGDWIVEFPMYDFLPSSFGEYEADYTIELRDTATIDATFSDAKVYTQAVTTVHPLAGYDFSGQVGREIGQQGVVTLWPLIPFYGVRNAPVTSRGYISTMKASVLYSHIVLNRLNADAYTQTVSINPRVQAWLNRPMKVQLRDHIGTVKNISHSIVWGASGYCETSLTMNAMRGWDGTTEKDGDKINKVYYSIGGEGARPLNYRLLLDPPPKTYAPVRMTKTGMMRGH
jgi:hypothetical protein